MKSCVVSVIIVAYSNQKVLKNCLDSIPQDPTIETIVIDNTHNNRGFSRGCNAGAAQAHGKYLFFLNPDTVLQPDTIALLIERIQSDTHIGIIAPQLRDKTGKPYRSFSQQPRWYSFPLFYSAVRNWLPQQVRTLLDPYEQYSLTEDHYVEGVSGAALMISKELFNTIGGFDERFFLYWEDYEIAQAVLKMGKKVLFYPRAFCMHQGGGTTTDTKKTQRLFQQSRFVFLKKRFGILYAVVVEGALRVSEAL